MLDYQGLYHTGVRVPDLDAAMAELGPGLGVDWCEVQQREQAVWLPESGPAVLPLRFTYSRRGPQHVELLEGPPGSIWDGRQQPGVHHVGIWVDDVGAETQRLLHAGWQLRIAQRSPEEGYGAFTYVQPPNGMLVELVWGTLRPMFDRWFAGESLG